jgi:transcriptional regulator with XRE-family HTH domain
MDSIAQRLRCVREASGLGTKVLSELCGLSGSHVRMIEQGDVASPDLKTLERIAATTGVPVAWLAFGQGDPPADDEVRAACEAARAPVEAIPTEQPERGAA